MEPLWLQIVKRHSLCKPSGDYLGNSLVCCYTGLQESFSGVLKRGLFVLLVLSGCSSLTLEVFLSVEEAVRLLPDISSDWPCLDQRFVPAPISHG